MLLFSCTCAGLDEGHTSDWLPVSDPVKRGNRPFHTCTAVTVYTQSHALYTEVGLCQLQTLFLCLCIPIHWNWNLRGNIRMAFLLGMLSITVLVTWKSTEHTVAVICSILLRCIELYSSSTYQITTNKLLSIADRFVSFWKAKSNASMSADDYIYHRWNITIKRARRSSLLWTFPETFDYCEPENKSTSFIYSEFYKFIFGQTLHAQDTLEEINVSTNNNNDATITMRQCNMQINFDHRKQDWTFIGQTAKHTSRSNYHSTLVFHSEKAIVVPKGRPIQRNPNRTK